jgi:hypothetical protein
MTLTAKPVTYQLGIKYLEVACQRYHYLRAFSHLVFAMLRNDPDNGPHSVPALEELADCGVVDAHFHLGMILSPLSGFRSQEKDGAKAALHFEKCLGVTELPLEIQAAVSLELGKLWYHGCIGVNQDKEKAVTIHDKGKLLAKQLGIEFAELDGQPKEEAESRKRWLTAVVGIGVAGMCGYAGYRRFLRPSGRGQ